MEPITRSEQYLASIIGEDVVLPVPQSRIEHYLNLIAQNGISPSSAGLISYDPDADYPDGSLGAGMKAEAAEVDDLKSAIVDVGENILAVYPTDTASGAVASFVDGADGVPVKSLVADITPVQSGTGDPSPDNVRPISGWTQAKVWVESTYDTTADPAVTVDLGGTVYGGTLDVTTGVLTVTHKGITFSAISGRASNGIFYLEIDGDYQRYNNPVPICNIFKGVRPVANTTSMASEDDGTIAVQYNSSYNRLFIKYTAMTTEAAMNTWLSSNPVTFVYELATPTTYQLTAQEVSTLYGANNIWADTGDVTVEYRADIELYIQKLTGSTEEDMIADAPIASGKYFLVGNRLFLSTAAIAAGAKLTPGTNCTETNLAAALNAINS